MYELFSKLVETINNVMYSYLLIIMLLGVGLYFTFRTKFIQFRLLGESIRLVGEKKEGDENTVSAYNAYLVFTVPIVMLIVMKYSLNIEGDSDGDPVEVLVHDKVLLTLCVVYLAAMFLILYL